MTTERPPKDNKEDNTEELQKRYVLPVEIIRRESTA